MAVLPDVPEPAEVLRLHQYKAGAWRCTCGEVLPQGRREQAMAEHQLLMLAAANLSVVPTNGTAAVVSAAAAVVNLMEVQVGATWHLSLRRLREAVHRLA